MFYTKDALEPIWEVAKNKYKIQQIQEEWEWMINKTVNTWDEKKNILEIGCYDGGSSYYLSKFASKMVTMDWHNPARFDTNALNCAKLSPRLYTEYTYIGGDSHDPKNIKKMLEEFGNDMISFAFIDGDHSYEGVKADFNNIVPYLPFGCAVVLHDIAISDFHHDHGCYVGEFWKEIKDLGYKTEEYSVHEDWAGIGIVWIE